MGTSAATASMVSMLPEARYRRAASRSKGGCETAPSVGSEAAGSGSGRLFGRMGHLPLDLARLAAELLRLRLPGRMPVGEPDLHRRHLVFRAVGRPVGEVGGDDIRAALGMVEGGVDHAGLDALGDARAQR